MLAGHWGARQVGADAVVAGVAVLRAAVMAGDVVRCWRQWAVRHGRALALLFQHEAVGQTSDT